MENDQKSITVVTGNKSKAQEIEAIIGFPTKNIKLDIPEIQAIDISAVARAKVCEAYKHVNGPVIVDDTGMSIDALGGLPGAFVSWFLDRLGPKGVLQLVEASDDRRASVSTCIAFADGEVVQTFVGSVSGTLTQEPRGTSGFGYDPIFVPHGETRTYAEMTSEEKNSRSMRKIALTQLRDYLTQHWL